MNGKHTKGKWEIRRWGKNGEEIYVGAEYNICAMLYSGHPEDIEANARLMAAAPELLEAIKALIVYAFGLAKRVDLYNELENDIIYAAQMPDLKQALEQARAAIKAAEGRE